MRALAVLIAALAACGGSDGVDDGGAVEFAFRARGLSSSEEFRVRTRSPTFIAQARAELMLPEAQRLRFPGGALAAGNGGYNLNWSWHLSDAELTEVSIDLCNGRPSTVEADLPYWLGTVKRFCPSGARVHAELR